MINILKYSKATLINTLRKRTGLEREAMIKFSNLHERSLDRIQNEQQNPDSETFEYLMKAISLPLESFVYPKLDTMSMSSIIECDLLIQLIDLGDTKQAGTLIKKFESMDAFDEGVNKQFLLSKKARLWEMEGKPANKILKLIDEAFFETYECFDDTKIGEFVLVLEEPDLLHTKARIYAKTGKIHEAIDVLNKLYSSMEILPAIEKDKERLFAPILLSLSEFLLKTCEFEKAIEICNKGAEYSALRNRGKYNPCFELHSAFALKGLERNEACRKHLQHAYFGYMLLGDVDKATEIIKIAENEFSIIFDLYGVDKMAHIKRIHKPYNRGEAVDCDSIGSMINKLRIKEGISLDKLSRGICDRSTLMRIEQGKSPGHLWNLEAIMQRLGRDISIYENFFLSKEDFIAIQMRDNINALIIDRKENEAIDLLSELEDMKNIMKFNVFKQFVLMTKAFIFDANQKNQPVNSRKCY